MSTLYQGAGVTVVSTGTSALDLYSQLNNAHLLLITQASGSSSHTVLNFSPVALSPVTSVSWTDEDTGKREIRVYYLDIHYVIQELSSSGGTWTQGTIGTMGVVANPSSGLGVIVELEDDDTGAGLRVYYQDAATQRLKALVYQGAWKHGTLDIGDALGGTSIAAVRYRHDFKSFHHIYYQARDLNLREHVHTKSGGWVVGNFAPGKAPGRTPLTTINFGKARIQVYWRNEFSELVMSDRKNGTTWIAARRLIGDFQPSFQMDGLFQRDANQKSHLSIFYQDSNDFLRELRSTDEGATWFAVGV